MNNGGLISLLTLPINLFSFYENQQLFYKYYHAQMYRKVGAGGTQKIDGCC
jgi:hypothetical protein